MKDFMNYFYKTSNANNDKQQKVNELEEEWEDKK